MSVGLEDKAERFAFVAHPDPNILVASRWTRWTIPLRDFALIDVTGVKAMHIRIGDPNASTPGGTGTIYIDDIRLTNN